MKTPCLISCQKRHSGFTLIEILLVIGIIAVLATVVIVALDPVTRFEDARNSRRLSDIQNIQNAIQQYAVDNKGVFPPRLDTAEKQISTSSSGCAISGNCNVTGDSDCIDLSTELARYLKSIPYDPENGSTEAAHYSVAADANNIVTVTACDATDPTIASVSQ